MLFSRWLFTGPSPSEVSDILCFAYIKKPFFNIDVNMHCSDLIVIHERFLTQPKVGLF